MTARRTDPLLDAGVRGCIVNMARKNLWRVSHSYDLDDLIQDGYMLWFKVRARYPDVKNVKHLTALFKTTFSRHIIDMANERSAGEEVVLSQIMPDGKSVSEVLDSLLGASPEEATFATLLRNAPGELRLLWRFLNSVDGREKLRRPHRWVAGIRETTNQFLCRHLGLDPDVVNLESMAREWFA